VEISVIWQQCLSLLKEQLGEQTCSTWLSGLKPTLKDGSIHVIASNRLVHDYIKNKYWDKINQTLDILCGGISAELIVADNKSKAIVTETLKETQPAPSTLVKSTAGRPRSTRSSANQEIAEALHNATKLNINYTFDSLIKGNSNQLAYAIGLHVTQQPGHKNHNPLFVYGGVGLGKTHLMQAIGNEISRKNPKAKVRYLHANDYIQDVVKASMRQGFDELKKYYNSLDLLLMDDIQFIAGDKTKTQEEFFYTFNTLLEKSKQVIMTCDTYPRNISNLNERLISRFTSGLTVEIQPPELEMRVAIIKCKAEQIKITLDDEVAFFIAQNIKSNVRELEGALNKVVYQAQFSGKGISLNIAKEALVDILASESRNISIDEIQKTICDFYKIKLSDLLSTKRTHAIVKPRQIAMTLAKELTQFSLPTIGSAFGGRDHTTVLHAQKTVSSLRKSDTKVEREYKLLLQMLNN
jgi:chromosomal replication initiator protein